MTKSRRAIHAAAFEKAEDIAALQNDGPKLMASASGGFDAVKEMETAPRGEKKEALRSSLHGHVWGEYFFGIGPEYGPRCKILDTGGDAHGFADIDDVAVEVAFAAQRESPEQDHGP